LIDKFYKSGVFTARCDTPECDFSKDYDVNNNWNQLVKEMKEDGWKSKKIDDKWKNYCSTCESKKEESNPTVEQQIINNKHDHFSYELSFIKDENIKNWTIKAIDSLPDYIFTIAASTTGKHHPSFSLGNGGLKRHIQVATRFAIRLFTILDFTDEEKDMIIASLLLHDGGKCGIDKQCPFTRHDHPLLICDHLRKQEFFNDISCAEEICKNIESHMGQWVKARNSKIVLPLPETKMQNFVHMCDYLSAWKELDYKFDIVEGLNNVREKNIKST
jgi:hypothetical protein